MYLMKAKKNFASQDEKEIEQKVTRAREKEASAAGFSTSSKKDSKSLELNPEDLPDGACFRPKTVHTGKDDGTAVRPAKYLGSFSVDGADDAGRAEFVRKELVKMRQSSIPGRDVLVAISLSGIKICTHNGESVLMAHGLKRISYSSFDRESCQFSFLARAPKGPMSAQFCHVFRTDLSKQAEEINTMIGDSFKMAYAQQRGDPQPTFHEVIEQQLQEQKAKFTECQEEAQRVLERKLKEISTPTPFSEKAMQRMELRRQSSNPDTSTTSPQRQWARKHATGTQHKTSIESDHRISAPVRNQSREAAIADRPHSDIIHTQLKQENFASPLPSNRAKHKALLKNLNNNAYKGSPVTMLKDSIDRCNGDLPLCEGMMEVEPEDYMSPNCQHCDPHCQVSPKSMKMVNRPLPDVPFDAKRLSLISNDEIMEITTVHSDPAITKIINIDTDKSSALECQPYCINYPIKMEQAVQGSYPIQMIESSKKQGAKNESSQKGARKKTPVKSRNEGKSKTKGLENASDVSDAVLVRHSEQAMAMLDRDVYTCSAVLPEGSPARSPKQRHSYPDERYVVGPFESCFARCQTIDRSHIDDSALRHCSWYQPGLPRHIALEILQQEDVGSFVVRDSSTHPGCYALSIKVPKFDNPAGISHYLVIKTQKGVKLKGLEKEWSSLTSLVTHFTVMAEILPCRLQWPLDSRNLTFKKADVEDKDEDPDYQKFADFRKLMQK